MSSFVYTIIYNMKISTFLSVGALKRDNQFCYIDDIITFPLSHPPSNTKMHCKKLECDIVYSFAKGSGKQIIQGV